MKRTEKESASTNTSSGGDSGRGRGFRGRGGGRGGDRSTAARGSGRGDQRRPAAAGGRGRGNHGRHPRQPAKSPNKQEQVKQHQGGRGRGGGRPRSSSYNDKSDDCYTAKKSGLYAHLFCSERHAFALSRVFYPRNNDQFLLPLSYAEGNNKRQIASDNQFEQWWDSVKIVRCHVAFNESTDANSSEQSNRLSSLERCPICLDEEMTSPFIAPCGHTFCLPCVLGYLNSVAKDLNDESDRIHKKKQNVKVGSGVVGSSGLTARASITSVCARCPMCSSGASMVLNAGQPMITYKDLRPVLFVPTLAITAASVGEAKSGKGKKSDNRHENSPRRGTRMKFVKLHRVKSCSAPYLPLHGNRVRGALTSASSTSSPDRCLPDLPDGDDDTEECIYTRQYFVGMNEYEDILQRDLNDLNNYREASIHCQLDPRENWNVSMAIEAVQAAQRRWLGSSGNDGFRGMELEAKSAAVISKQAEQTLLAETSVEIENSCTDEEAKPRAKSQKNHSLLQPGSVYLHQNLDSNSSQGEPDEFLYYQSSDGQPCFLSGINGACLMHEFSLYQQPTDVADHTQDEDTKQDQASPSTHQRHTTVNNPRNTLPLPDELTGTVLEIEQVAVTNSLIKRKHFLSHIPLNSSVTFVEIDWYSGGDGGNRPMLSHSTLSKFRGELQRRKSERLRAVKREQKADKVARVKSEKDEQRQRRELLGYNYLYGGTRQQTIDPDDEFFQAPAASFDELEEVVQQNRSATFQFNEVCATGGVWPELLSSSNHGHQEATTTAVSPVESSPAAAMATSSPQQTNATWGSRKHSTAAKVVPVVVDNFPSLTESSKPTLQSLSKGRAKSNDSPWGSR